jgi:hypothetical protein
MLRALPEERISIDDALAHPFLAKFASIHEETTTTPFRFDFERLVQGRDSIRRLMYTEVLDMRRATLQDDEDVAGAIRQLAIRRSHSQ